MRDESLRDSKGNLSSSVIITVYRCRRVNTNSTECVNKGPGMRGRKVFMITAAALGAQCTLSR